MELGSLSPMKIRWAFLTIALMVPVSIAHAAEVGSCDFEKVTSTRELNDLLGKRSVEIVALAGRKDQPSADRLAKLVAPHSPFSLGASDVGRPLGKGVDGARALAATMKADEYGFAGWDFMDMPTNGCGHQVAIVIFVNKREARRSEVKFSFDNGRLTSAEGWETSYNLGRLEDVR